MPTPGRKPPRWPFIAVGAVVGFHAGLFLADRFVTASGEAMKEASEFWLGAIYLCMVFGGLTGWLLAVVTVGVSERWHIHGTGRPGTVRTGEMS
jgi:hypothetical protein